MEERERACDEDVLRQGGKPEVYAEAIVNVCKNYVESPLACVSGVSGADLKKRIEGIMKNRVLHTLNLAQKAALVLAAAIAVAGPVALGVLHSPVAARAQEGKQQGKQPAGKIATAFDAATIKPNTSGAGMGQFAGSPRGLRLINYKARMVIRMAFGNLPDTRISGGPDWMDKDAYDIEGVFAPGERAAPPDMYQPVLRALLASRFGMKWHFETKEFPVYELVVAKNGPKLTPNTDGRGLGGTNTPGKFIGHQISMAALANRFPGSVGRVVVDKTGLTGEYDLELTWDPSLTPASENPGGPSIFTAIEEQLGLRLQPGKAPLEVLVIDSLQKPTEN